MGKSNKGKKGSKKGGKKGAATPVAAQDVAVEVVEEKVIEECPLILGYHQIRGLAAGLRMMMAYKKQSYTNAAYGADMKETWFGKDKPELLKKNACINLPYIVDGDEVVTQSNTCTLYLGRKLAIDHDVYFFHNHTVLDQTMDLRNDLMKIVYPFAGACPTKDAFPEAAKSHLAGPATTHLTKLENFCKGVYMCGDVPQSGDFQVFEMLDQHASISASIGEASFLDKFPKLKNLHASMKALPALAPYFSSDAYLKWAQNNGLFTHFTGLSDDFVYGATTVDKVTF